MGRMSDLKISLVKVINAITDHDATVAKMQVQLAPFLVVQGLTDTEM
jgi:hypothetical protein